MSDFFIYDRFIASTACAVYEGCSLTIGNRCSLTLPIWCPARFCMVSDQHRRVLYPTLFDKRAGVF